MRRDRPPEPWHSFFLEIDRALDQVISLHCLGGFAMAAVYGLPRPTVDVDCVSVVPIDEIAALQELAGERSVLHSTHGVYLQHVGVVTVPEDYEGRLIAMFSSAYRHLRLWGLEGHDLALSKIERNSGRDREDVKFLARAVPLDPGMLEKRYYSELRPYLGNQSRHDLTIRLWLEMLAAV